MDKTDAYIRSASREPAADGRHQIRALIALMLTLVILFQTVLSVHAAGENAAALSELYISDVAIGTAKSLTAAGYKVDESGYTGRYMKSGSVLKNGNSSNVFGDGVCIGYKTTADRNDAITDLSVMDMYGGYNKLSYMDLLKEQRKDMLSLARDVQTAANEFKSRYRSGNQYAKLAYTMLNYLTVPAENGRPDMLLGDYLTSDSLQLTEDDFVNLVFICSSVVTTYIYSQLCFGVADDRSGRGSTTWVERLVENGPFVLEGEDGEPVTDPGVLNDYYEENLDGTYYQRAVRLYDSVKYFADEYRAAVARSGKDPQFSITASGAEAVESRECDAIRIDLSENGGQTVTGSDKDQCSDAVIIALYESLDKRDEDGEPVYYYGENEDGTTRSLAEFFLEVGSADLSSGDSTNDIYRELYPLIMEQYGSTPMTAGQEVMFYISGFNASVSVAVADLSLSETEQSCREKASGMLSLNGGQAVSVWFNVDRTMYEGDSQGVYWTSSLARITAAKSRYDLLTQPVPASEYDARAKLKDAMLLTGAAALTMSTVSTVVGNLVTAFSSVSAAGDTIAAVASAYWAGEALSYSTTTCVACVVAEAMSVMVAVSVVILVVMALIYLIIDIVNQKSSDLNYTDIPKEIYDFKDEINTAGCAVKYSQVKAVGVDSPDSSGVFSYYRNNRCFPWVCVYYTKDASAGKPLTVAMSGSSVATAPFVSYYSGKVMDASLGVNIRNVGEVWISKDGLEYERQMARGTVLMTVQLKSYSDPAVSEGYSPLHGFGENSMYNFAYYGSDGFKGSDEDRLKNLCFATNLGWYLHREGGAVVERTEGKYLSDVILASESTIEAARDKILSAGYTLIDEDLTSDSKVHTYVGYTTTSAEIDALTDLRFTYASGIDPKSGTVTYGGATYGCCGNVGDLCLMETSKSTAGTPITAEGFAVTHERMEGTGSEPVNLFCGGPALNINGGGDWKIGSSENSKNWATGTYLYFRPTTVYAADAENAQEYIGGVAFFSGQNIDQYIQDTGWTVLSDTDISGHQYNGLQIWDNDKSCKTVICYSTTCNPYRAVYGLTQYTCEPMSSALIYNLNIGGAGYVTCDVFQQGGVGMPGSNDRLIRYSHGYRSSNYVEGTYSDSEASLEKKNRAGTQECVGVIEFDDSYSTPYCPIMRDVLTAGLYTVGNTSADISSAKPLKVGELTASSSPSYSTAAQTPVRSMTDWFSGTGANLGYVEEIPAEYMSKFSWCNHVCNEQLYLYVNRPDTARGMFVDSVKVAYSGGEKGAKKSTDSPYDAAVAELVSAGPGQLIEVNLCVYESEPDYIRDNYLESETAALVLTSLKSGSSDKAKSDASYEHRYNQIRTPSLYESCNYSDEIAYIWVTYTNSVMNNLSDLRLYESDCSTAPAEITLSSGSKAHLCGDGFRVDDGSTYFFLYSVRGLGTRITELSLGTDVFHLDDWTTISTDGTAPSYTKYFIYADHYRNTRYEYYVTGICSSTGSDERSAQLGLLDQGCRYACPFNLSPGLPNPIYMGYTLSSNVEKAYSGLFLANNGQDETVDEIYVGKDNYFRISDNLNTGVYDAIISLYGTTSKRKAHENDPSGTTNGHYVSSVLFWYDSALADCFTGSDSEVSGKVSAYLSGLSAEDRAYLEHYLYDDDGSVIRMNAVTDYDYKVINCNLGAQNFVSKKAKTADVYMFIHYSDNYVRELSLIGTLFSPQNAVWVVLTAVVLLAGAASVILIKKKRATPKQQASAEDNG